MVKNSKSAIWALAAAGGLWAWQNRDKLRQWAGSPQVRDAISNLTSPGSSSGRPSYPAVGETRRIRVETPDDATEVQRDPFGSGI